VTKRGGPRATPLPPLWGKQNTRSLCVSGFFVLCVNSPTHSLNKPIPVAHNTVLLHFLFFFFPLPLFFFLLYFPLLFFLSRRALPPPFFSCPSPPRLGPRGFYSSPPLGWRSTKVCFFYLFPTSPATARSVSPAPPPPPPSEKTFYSASGICFLFFSFCFAWVPRGFFLCCPFLSSLGPPG